MSDRPQNRNLKPFPKGQSGNPHGRPKKHPDLQLFKELNQIKFAKIVSKFLSMRISKIEIAKQHPKTTSIELAIISLLEKAIKKGDIKILGWLVDGLP